LPNEGTVGSVRVMSIIVPGAVAAVLVALVFLGCWLIVRDDPEFVGMSRLKLRSPSLDRRIELFVTAVAAGDYHMADRAVRRALELSAPPEE
jgi:hypothetical protein